RPGNPFPRGHVGKQQPMILQAQAPRRQSLEGPATPMSYSARSFLKAAQFACPSLHLTATPSNFETGISDKEAPRAPSRRSPIRKKKKLLNEEIPDCSWQMTQFFLTTSCLPGKTYPLWRNSNSSIA